MQSFPFQYIWLTALISLALAAAAGALGRMTVARALALLGCLACAATLLGVAHVAHRFPLHGPLEAFSEIALIVSLLGLGRGLKNPGGPAPAWSWGISAGLLALAALGPLGPIADFYLYDYPWLIMFFQLRLVAVALLLYATLLALSSLGGRKEGQPNGYLAGARNFLVLASAFYLASEFSGCNWALNWTGDYWRWSSSFLQSTMMFLLVTLALHLPLVWSRRPRTAAWLTALPGVVIVSVVVWQQLVEV